MPKKIIDYIKRNQCAIFIVLLLYISNDTVLFGTNGNKKFFYFSIMFLMFILLFFILRILKKRIIKSKSVLVLICLIFLALLTSTFKDYISLKYLYEFMLLGIAFGFTQIYSHDEFISNYITAILLVAKLSLIPYVINIVFRPILNLFPTIINSSGIRFHNLFIGNVLFDENYNSIYRNFSFFREPGVFAVFILIGVLFLLQKKQNQEHFIRKFMILFITMVTTLSTGGIISLFLATMIYFFTEKTNYKKKLLIVVIFVILIYMFNSDTIMKTIFGKLYVVNSSSVSRLSSVFINLKIFMNNILFGVGLENIVFEYPKVAASMYQNTFSNVQNMFHNTNSIFKLLSVHGIIYFAIYISGIIKFFLKSSERKGIALLILLNFFVILSNEDLTFNIFLPIIMFYGYNTLVKKKE